MRLLEILKTVGKVFWRQTSIVRTFYELVYVQVVGVILWLLVTSLPMPASPLPRQDIFFAGYFLISLVWCLLHWRSRSDDHSRWRRLAYEIMLAALLGLELLVSLNLLALILGGSASLTFLRQDQEPFMSLKFDLLTAACGGLFLILRISVPILMLWNRLRRRHLRWALTHAHLMVVVIGAAVISALLVLLGIIEGNNASDGLTRSFSPLFLFFGMIALTIIVLLFVLPPSALFSYIFARHTTQRIEKLAGVTSALRNRRYSERVVVEGKDEIARLQTDFNAMAENLERTMRELQEERDTVARLLQARRELIASVSHELRTPVATVRGYLESTLSTWDDQPPQTLRQDLQTMEQQTVRLQALINDLFTLARAEVGQLEMRCVPTNLELLLGRVVETMAPLVWRGSKIELIADLAPHLPNVIVDESRLEQVVQNLLHNAVRHTPPGGIIVVSASFDETVQMVALQVKDTGEGIAPEELARIWERFYRAENARNHPGTGLGLAIVKELAETMGGHVSVSSVVGQGTCFTLHLPLA